MNSQDNETKGTENTPIPDENHEEKHESKLHHIIHEITEEVKGLFDLDTFLHSDGSITGGINGTTEDEIEENEQ